MPRIELSEKIIARLRGRPADDPSREPLSWYDIKMPGFGIAISSKTNSRSFFVEREVNGQKRRKTIGKVGGKLNFKEAKQEARDMIYRMDRGWDPRQGRRGGVSTLQSALEAYLAGRDIAERTSHAYRHRVEHHLSDWLDKPLAAITGEMVEQRYMKLSGPDRDGHHDCARSGLSQRRQARPQAAARSDPVSAG
jgi:hypothetical protein